MFQYLYYPVSYWEKKLARRLTSQEEKLLQNSEKKILQLSSNSFDDDNDKMEIISVNNEKLTFNNNNAIASSSSSFSLSVPSFNPIRRMTSPSIDALEYATRQVVTLDPVYTSHTDLDDISQPENGVVADVEISATESESDASGKDEEEQQINETPYVSNENEVLGSVSLFF